MSAAEDLGLFRSAVIMAGVRGALLGLLKLGASLAAADATLAAIGAWVPDQMHDSRG